MQGNRCNGMQVSLVVDFVLVVVVIVIVETLDCVTSF